MKSKLSKKMPWLKFYGDTPAHLDYKESSMCEWVEETANRFPTLNAIEYFGKSFSYSFLIKEINKCASALIGLGIKKGEKVSICLPNIPQAVIMFYALNKIGAVSCMIHPLSGAQEIEEYLEMTESKGIIVLDLLFEKVRSNLKRSNIKHIFICSLDDYMNNVKGSVVKLKVRKKMPKIPFENKKIVRWKNIQGLASKEVQTVKMTTTDTATILFSGGTTGKSKGIMLSNLNFNALSEQVSVQLPKGKELAPGDSVLAILPIFHGFGLAVCVHGFLTHAGKVILIPRFDAELMIKRMKKDCPAVIAGVPTLFEALIRNKKILKADLSNLRGVFGGGDKVPASIKSEVDKILKKCGSTTNLREGYGLTETVTVCTLMPENTYKQGSIGIPISDMYAKIVEVGTTNELNPNCEGEICISGPTVMLGYLNEEKETKSILKIHDDGLTWVHTGDIGYMDKDGFIFFKLRQKRMIKVSGISVYPTQTEELLYSHPDVESACCIGIPDTYKMNIMKAFIVLKDKQKASDEMKSEIITYLRQRINNWSVPKVIEFRDDLPKTKVGKIDFTRLEKEEIESMLQLEDHKLTLTSEKIADSVQEIKFRESHQE
ncbi:MAG: AMP-binding protein [Spirochaetales bacterium]|nr:AMP-binding protein [Spirochaetales bacterium]